MSNRTLAAALFATVLAAASPALAQVPDPAEPTVDPTTPGPHVEAMMGLRAVTSVNGALDTSNHASGLLDFSDTYAYVRPRVSLYNDALRAGAMFALTFPEVYVQPGTVFVAEANAFVESRWFTLRIGRGRMSSRAIAIPTLRDDDLIRYTDLSNPFSLVGSSADQQFGNVLDVTFWMTPRWYADVHVDNLPNLVLQPQTLASFAINSYGLTAGYRQIPALATTSFVRQVAVGANLSAVDLPGQAVMFEALAGGWINLFPDPVHNVDLRAQAIYNRGTDVTALRTINDTYRAPTVSAVASLGYTYRRDMMPAFRANLIGAWRRYLDAGANQISLVANAFVALGPAFEVGLQYQFQDNDPAVPLAFGEAQIHSLKLALVGSFETVVGRRFADRDSILNTQSGYVP
jgi:hypothetical protein